MILKGRDAPLSIHGYEVLLKRLPTHHEKYWTIHDKYLSAKAGRGGEEEFDRVVSKHRIGVPHIFLHDISLNYDFQADSILLTPSYFHIFEVKNLGGELIFLPNPLRVEQKYEDGQIKVRDLSQLDHAVYYLGGWLKSMGIRMPIKRAFILPYPKKFENKTDLTVLYPNSVPPYIRNISNSDPVLSESRLLDVANQLKNEHQRFLPFPMCSRWGIDPKELRTGVECEKCGMLGMNKVARGWFCRKCSHFSSTAHERAMEEYFMLVGDTITNIECRRFLGIEDRYAAKRIMKSMNLTRDGSRKGSIYRFDYKKLFH